MKNLENLAETLEQMSYQFMAFIGAIFGSTWTIIRLMEVSIEAFAIGMAGAFGSMLTKHCFEKCFGKKEKKRISENR